MKLIVGLGNPGKRYAETRHNVGFMAIKKLADRFDIRNINKDCEALIAKGKIKNNKVLLAQPLTYMNNSGRAVKKLADKYNIDFADIIIIYDDLDLPAGKLRIKPKGSSGGHKGLQSVMDSFNTEQIIRIRIGIGRPINLEVTDYVLQKFDKAQKKEIDNILSSIDEIILEILENDVSSSMSKFN
ncbi:MAG: aminoacyl-tRNA hydrolase [Bacillota bacterium]